MEPPTRRLSAKSPWRNGSPGRACSQQLSAPRTRNALVFIAGTNWAYDLRGMPMDLPNVVYSTHVYAEKGNDWPAAFGNLSASAPVFVGEFGGTDLDFGRRLMKDMQDLGIGWAAWSWF